MLRAALISGSIACVATLAAAALLGARERGSAVAPVNATSHVLWGEEAAQARAPDLQHTVAGVALNEGACVFWAAFYEKAFGRRAERGDVAAAVAGEAPSPRSPISSTTTWSRSGLRRAGSSSSRAARSP